MRTVRSMNGLARGEDHLHLTIYGMRDATTARTVYETLATVEGIRQIHLDVNTRRATIIHDGSPDLTGRLGELLNPLGFRVLTRSFSE